MGCYDIGNIDMSIKHELEQKPDQLSWRIKAVIFFCSHWNIALCRSICLCGTCRRMDSNAKDRMDWIDNFPPTVIAKLPVTFFPLAALLETSELSCIINALLANLFSWFCIDDNTGKSGRGNSLLFLRQKEYPFHHPWLRSLVSAFPIYWALWHYPVLVCGVFSKQDCLF